jgi:hypothetical protein
MCGAPHCPNLLASRLVALDKTRGADGVDGALSLRPIAIGEVWVYLAGLCTLQAGAHSSAALAPLQLGIGVKGGVQILGHALRAGTETPAVVTLQVDRQHGLAHGRPGAGLGAPPASPAVRKLDIRPAFPPLRRLAL